MPAVAEGTKFVVGVFFFFFFFFVVRDIRDEKIGFGFRGLLVFV